MKKWALVAIVAALALVLLSAFAGPALAAGPLIVIDPGHSGGTLLSVDPQFNMYDYEYNNGQENYDNWNVAVALKAKLQAAGYQVLLTKTGPEDIVSKRARVNMATNNRAALLVSIHRDGYTFGTWGHVYVQMVGGWRADVTGKHVAFNLPDVAARSAVIGNAILSARKAIEGSAITMAVESFTGRGGYIPDGNLAITQLWATVPSVLCEAGICDTAAKQDKYAQGVFNGIVASIPVAGTVTPPPPPPPPAPGPTVTLSLTEGQVLKLSTAYTVTAKTTGAVKVVFYLDGSVFSTDTTSPFSIVFKPSKKGTRTIEARAYSKTGVAASATVHVVVK